MYTSPTRVVAQCALGRAHDEARRRRPVVPVEADRDVGLDHHIADGVRLPSPRRRLGLRGRGAPPQALRGGGSDRTVFSTPPPRSLRGDAKVLTER